MKKLLTIVLLLIPFWCYEMPLSKPLTIVKRADFMSAFTFVKNNEGGYNPSDEGSDAYVGINRKWNKDWEGWKYVDEAKKVSWDSVNQPMLDHYVLDYYLTIWVREGFDELRDQRTANYLFDMRIHVGGPWYTMIVNRTGTTPNAKTFLTRVRLKRIDFYNSVAKIYPSKKKSLPHWLLRANQI